MGHEEGNFSFGAGIFCSLTLMFVFDGSEVIYTNIGEPMKQTWKQNSPDTGLVQSMSELQLNVSWLVQVRKNFIKTSYSYSYRLKSGQVVWDWGISCQVKLGQDIAKTCLGHLQYEQGSQICLLGK